MTQPGRRRRRADGVFSQRLGGATPRGGSPTAVLGDGISLAAAVRHLARADSVMGRLVDQVGPCRLKPEPKLSPFASLRVRQHWRALGVPPLGGRRPK
jgi:hypothetical protein